MHMLSFTRKRQAALESDSVKFVYLPAISKSSLLFIPPHFCKHFPHCHYFCISFQRIEVEEYFILYQFLLP